MESVFDFERYVLDTPADIHVVAISLETFCRADEAALWVNRSNRDGIVCLSYPGYTISMTRSGDCFAAGNYDDLKLVSA